MKTKADIEIVTGFIGAGKTAFINALITNTYIGIEKLLIIQYEQGNTAIEDYIKDEERIILETADVTAALDSSYVQNLIEIHNPTKVIIEYNGTKPLSNLLDIISTSDLRKIAKVTSVFFVADSLSYNMFINNMPMLITPNLAHCNLVVLNNSEKIDKKELSKIKKDIRLFNRDTFLLTLSSTETISEVLEHEYYLDRGLLKLIRVSIKNLLSKL